jgi:hypothetical protein
MKLLNANEVRVKNDSQIKAEIHKTQQIKLELWQETRKLMDFKEKAEVEKEKIFRGYLSVQQKLDKECEELKAEIKILEARRDNALKPLEILKSEIKERESVVSLAEQGIQAREEKINLAESALIEKKADLVII